MRRWWNRLFVVLIFAIAAVSIYAVWPDEPDRYFPDWLNLPSGRGLPGTLAGIDLPCHTTDSGTVATPTAVPPTAVPTAAPTVNPATPGTTPSASPAASPSAPAAAPTVQAPASANKSNPARDCRGMILGLDLQGGSRIVLQADLQGKADINIDEAMSAAKSIIENRINPFGVSEAQVQRSGQDRLVVELPGVSSSTARDITRPAVLMFCEPLQQNGRPGSIQGDATGQVASSPQAAEVYYKPGTCEPDIDAKSGDVALKGPDGGIAKDTSGAVQRITPRYGPRGDAASIIWTPALGQLNGAPTIMTGGFLKSNSQVRIDQFGQPILTFEMKDEGKKVFGSLTKRIQANGSTPGMPLATFLDGEPIRGASDTNNDGVKDIIAPAVQSEITDTGQTTGLTLSDAKRLRTFLNNGAFPVPLRVIQQQDLDASLGDEAVRHSVQAGLIAMLIIMAFMTLYYRLPGVLASLALVVYTAVVLALFKIGIPGSGPVTLTLAGIAAFVLSVGMAVDANILIFERTKEELRNGRSLIPAVEAGFDRAWSSIRDSNVSTLITCGILYWMGNAFNSSLIKGFALTLAIGVVISLFSAISVTRTFLRLAIATPLARRLWLWTDDKRDEDVPAGARMTDAIPEGADA